MTERQGPGDESRHAEDRALVKGLIEANPEAWEEFANRYGAMLTRTCSYILFRKAGITQSHDVENAVQQLLQALYKNDRRALRSFRWQSRFSTWLVAVAHRVCSKMLRSESRSPIPTGAQLPENLIAQSSEFGGADLPVSAEELNKALRILSPRHALLIKLVYFDGIRHREAAAIMGIRYSSIPTLMNRAKRRLREALLSKIAV
jgi:RNA polymerase sigma-70 factor (ECF subfamily)